ncbi:MAG TPA: hypothetical protein EYP59_07855 [Thiotrichaceae bacterium]|nr:hypothetical protein [Thiotrichaceae bacterium]
MRPLSDKRWRTGLLFVLLLVAIPKTFAALVLTTPEHKSEGYPYSEMGLWWKYDEDPQVAAEIEEQVEWVGLRLYETDDPDVYKTPKFSDYVGRCRLYDICWSCSLEFETKFRQSRTFASTAECGEELKPNQWYKWSVWVERDGASPLAKAGAFKTGDYRDIIIDDSDAGFTQSGPGPFSERGRGYNNTSLLVNTTWEENDNNNYCQWEWTIPEERTYEVSVFMPIKFFSGSRMGSSEQANYELWREGIGTRSKTIVQNWDYRNLWVSLGTHHFKAGQAKLRLSDNTGESAPLGRQLVCDAVRVRKRLGTPGESYVEAPSLRSGTRANEQTNQPSSPLYPYNHERMMPAGKPIIFEWAEISEATDYRLQISLFQHFDDPWIIKWLSSWSDIFKSWWWDAANNTEEQVENGQECGLFCMNIKTDMGMWLQESNKFVPSLPYYWRVRVENEEATDEETPLRFGQWSKVRQFTVLDDPAEPGPYPVGRVTWDEKNVISHPIDSKGKIAPRGQLFFHAWAQIMYPATQEGKDENNPVPVASGKYPVVVFLHGNHHSCDIDGEGPRFQPYSPTYDPTDPTSGCPDDRRIPNHKGYNYILERLASHGIIAVSISGNDINQWDSYSWNLWLRGQLILSVLDKLRDWDQGENGQAINHPVGQLFFNKLDMENIGLSGHSRGGEGVVAAQQFNQTRTATEKHAIKAVNAIAPTDHNKEKKGEFYLMTEAPYFLLVGARDNDVFNLSGFRTYDRFQRNYSNETGVGGYPKMAAFVYGANHNYFNTIWTDSDALLDAVPNEDLGLGFDPAGIPKKVNNWACSFDDANPQSTRCLGNRVPLALGLESWKISAKQQREIARRSIVAFFRWHLKGDSRFKEIFTGNYKPGKVYWSYQDAVRRPIDNFETPPVKVNNWGGQNTFLARLEENTVVECTQQNCYFDEYLFNRTFSNYTSFLPGRLQIPHDTNGLFFGWFSLPDDKQAIYTVSLPQAYDISAFTHLSFRVAMTMGHLPQQGLEIRLTSHKDNLTKRGSVQTKDFQVIPYPYPRQGGNCSRTSYQCQNQPVLSSVRIPLEVFEIDLTHLVDLKISAPGAWLLAIDDIEFGH